MVVCFGEERVKKEQKTADQRAKERTKRKTNYGAANERLLFFSLPGMSKLGSIYYSYSAFLLLLRLICWLGVILLSGDLVKIAPRDWMN